MIKQQSQSKRSKWVIYSTLAVTFPHWFYFSFRTYQLGGAALNGYVKSGHYFVGSHGGYTEVTQAIWTNSYWHGVAAMCGIFLLFAETAFFVTIGDIVLNFSCPHCGSRSTAWWNTDAYSGKCLNCGMKR